MESAENDKKEHEPHPHPEPHPKQVEVTVDRKKHMVAPGTRTVSVFKTEVRVDPAKELEEIVDGKLVPLADDAEITIKGGEVFVSHVRRGGSSWV